MRSFEYVEVGGVTPYDRGSCYGHKARASIRTAIDNYRAYFPRRYGLDWERLAATAMANVPEIEAAMPEILEEARGIAAGAGVAFADIMVLNSRYEITKRETVSECTTAAVLPGAGGGRTYLVKNWDFREGILDHIVVLHIEQADGTRILGICEAGQMIREGFNNHGVGTGNNALRSTLDGPGGGIPVTFLRRRVLASRSFEEAKRTALGANRSVSNNIMLASADGQAIDIEAAPDGCETIEPVADILTHANHFTRRTEIEAGRRSLRDVRLRELLVKRWGHIDVPYIQACMRDHENAPESVCRHPEGVDRNMTVAGLIVDFAEGVAHICVGPPCTGEYQKYRL